MQSLKGTEQQTGVVSPLIHRGWFAIETEDRIHRGLGGANRVFDGEDDVVGEFAILPHEREIHPTVWQDFGAITEVAREEQFDDFKIRPESASMRRCPRSSVMISHPLQADIGFLTKFPG